MIDHIVLTRLGNGVAELVLNRPEKHNAISPEMASAIRDARRTINDDDAIPGAEGPLDQFSGSMGLRFLPNCEGADRLAGLRTGVRDRIRNGIRAQGKPANGIGPQSCCQQSFE